ncbi:CaiB/BaiF CoA transferase family protein [Sphingomonas soli]|uniref:CaiB/BaiF CoA transferase family protein n=1 Tax=Sphingomonas soli TaxID=266127 RepID=UPI00082ADCAC|nr:CoA transferase [Sphingomonas soli]
MTIKPLSGIKVLDCTQVFAGPFATYQLALLGAEIIKVEPIGRGDTLRGYYHGSGAGNQMSGSFVAINSGKRSIALDIKSEEGKRIFRALVAASDVLVENFRSGVMERLGFGWDDCRSINPKLIYASLSGYGATGPNASHPALDHIIQAASGMMSLNGQADADPVKVGFPVIDSFAGYVAAFGVMAALLQRGHTGEGQRVDVGMLDVAMVLMTSMVVPYHNAGTEPPRLGNRGYSGSPTSDLFRTGDGNISIGANGPGHFEKLCDAIGASHIYGDPRFATPAARIENTPALRAEIESALAARSAEEWEPVIAAAGVPAAKLRTVSEALGNPQLKSRSLVQTVPLAAGKADPVTVLNLGFEASWESGAKEPSPLLGEHSDAILESLGYDASAIAQLRTLGVIG